MGITTRNHTDCKGSQVPSFGWKRNGCIYSGKATAARTMRQHTDCNSASQPHHRLTGGREGGWNPVVLVHAPGLLGVCMVVPTLMNAPVCSMLCSC